MFNCVSCFLVKKHAAFKWKDAIPGFPGSAEALVKSGGKIKYICFLGNIFAKNCWTQTVYVNIIASQRWDVFRHSVYISISLSVSLSICLLKAKSFMLAVRSWVEAGRRHVRNQIPLRYLVRSWSQTVRTSFEPDSVMEFGFERVCDQLRSSFEPGSVNDLAF